MQTEQYEVILSEIRKVAKRLSDAEAGITRIENDLAGDRREINDFKVKLGTVDARVKEFEGTLARMSNKLKDTTQNAIAEAVQPVVETTESLTSELKKKKTVRVPFIPDGIWQRFKMIIGANRG